jgi:inner membrane protein
MTWRTHFVGALAALWPLAPLGPDALAWAAPFATLGALLPDLDAADSKIARASVGGVAPLRPLSRLVFRSLGHRGPLHSLVAWLLITLLALPVSVFVHPAAGVGLSLGYLSHLLLDACTKSGVPLRWPDPTRLHLLPRPLRVTTGSTGEEACFFVLALAALSLFLTNLNPSLP